MDDELVRCSLKVDKVVVRMSLVGFVAVQRNDWVVGRSLMALKTASACGKRAALAVLVLELVDSESSVEMSV